jgi:hypothetical protein
VKILPWCGIDREFARAIRLTRMAGTTLRRRSQVFFTLLCLLLMMRMPAKCLIEESPRVTVGIEAHLSFDAEQSHACDPVLSAMAVLAQAYGHPVSTAETNRRLIEYSILRL